VSGGIAAARIFAGGGQKVRLQVARDAGGAERVQFGEGVSPSLMAVPLLRIFFYF